MTYNRDQFYEIVPHLPKDTPPKWFVIGGPADGNEAQCVVSVFPGIRVLGAEPNEEMRRWQLMHKWPWEANLLPEALSDGWGFRKMVFPTDNPRCSSFMEEREGRSETVSTTTLDRLDARYGPFEDVLLWLDIEGWEVPALEGGRGLFGRGAILAANVEVIHRRETEARKLESFFAEFGFRLAHTWNVQPGLCEDRVYVRRGVS